MIVLTLLILVFVLFVVGLGVLTILSPLLIDLAVIFGIIMIIKFIISLCKKGDDKK